MCVVTLGYFLTTGGNHAHIGQSGRLVVVLLLLHLLILTHFFTTVPDLLRYTEMSI